MSSAEPDHDSSFGQEIGSRYLAGQDRRMVYGYADDTGQETNSLRVLRGSNIESQRKRRARKFIFSKTLCRREEIIAQSIGEGDLLQDLGVSLPF